MNHTELEPGQKLLRKRYLSGGIELTVVSKITTKTVFTREEDYLPEWRHTANTGQPLYIYDESKHEDLKEIDDEIRELEFERSQIISKLERVTFK